MSIEIESSQWSVVLIGKFNPSIYHPSWFKLHEVISQEDFESSEVKLVHSEISTVSLGDIELMVDKNRFQVTKSVTPEITLLDFVSKVFGDILPHSHISVFGVNKTVKFRTPTAEKRKELGRRMAPLEPWRHFGENIKQGSGDTIGGLISLKMREIINDASTTGHMEVRIEPDYSIDAHRGVSLTLNRHVALKDYSESEGALRAISLLTGLYEPAQEYADLIVNDVLEQCS